MFYNKVSFKMKFLIIGIGNIGLRHVQALSNLSENNLEFYLFDKNISNEERFNRPKRNIIFKKIKSLNELTSINFELTIISTTTTDRVKILSNINKSINSKYIIIEKPISQSVYELKDLRKLKSDKIFVNFPRRYCDWHKKIKEKLNKDYISKNFRIEVSGGEIGLACNACHFVDLINFITNKLPYKVIIDKLGNWHKSKRDGFFEVEGSLKIDFEDNITLIIRSLNKKKNLEINFYDSRNNQILSIDYVNGFAKFSDGKIIEGRIKFQSESTHLFFNLIKKNDKNLCKLDKAITLYEPLIDGFIKHWNNKFKNNDNKIMIT